MANTNTREAQQRALAKLAERRKREDQLIETVTDALVTREQATEALAAAETALADGVAGLAELGIGRDELAEILEIPADQLGGKTRGRPKRSVAPEATPATEVTPDETPAVPAPEPKPARTTGRARKARATSRPDAAG